MLKRKSSRNGSKSAAVRRILTLARNAPDIDTAIMVVAEGLMKDVPHPPTDLEVLGQRLNVTGFEAVAMPLSGELRRYGREFRVAYSSYLPSSQRRFTIAHELGHAVFAITGRNYPRAGKDVERICDKFAAEFLMPTAEFQSRLGRDPTAASLIELASIFRTPLYSTAARAAELGGLSVFTIESQEVTWSHGLVRKGPFHKSGYYMKETLDLVLTSPSGDVIIPISGEIHPTEGRLTWTPIANGQRSFCLLRKIPASNPPKRIGAA